MLSTVTIMKPDDTIFVAREKELQELREFAHNAFSGKVSVAFITGEVGAGKTSLAKELLRRLSKEYDDLLVVGGRCGNAKKTYAPFRSMLKDLLTGQTDVIIPPEIVTETFLNVRTVLANTISAIDTNVMEIFLPTTICDEIIPKHPHDCSALILPRDLEQVQVFGWYTKVLKDIAQHFPLLLFVDDLHRADSSSLYLLNYLGRAIEEQRIMIIGTYCPPHQAKSNSLFVQMKNTLEKLLPLKISRSSEKPREEMLLQITTELLERPGVKEFPLRNPKENVQTSEEALQFVHTYLMTKYGIHFPERFEQALEELSEENPLFLTETLLDFEEKGHIKKLSYVQQTSPFASVRDRRAAHSGVCKRGRLHYNSSPEKLRSDHHSKKEWELPSEFEYIRTFPEQVEDVIQTRINRLAQIPRKIMEYACVQGDDFIPDVIPNMPHVPMNTHLEMLKSRQFILKGNPQTLPDGTQVQTFCFRHPLIREHLYTHLPPQTRKQLHAETGRHLEHLYELNTNTIVAELARHFYHGQILDKAIHYCLKAAEDANKRLGTPEAVRFGLMGLDALKAGEPVSSQKHYAEYKWNLLLELAKAEEHGGDQQADRDHIPIGIAHLENHLPMLDVGRDELYAQIYGQLGKLYARRATKGPAAKEYFEQALTLSEQCNDRMNLSQLLYYAAHILPTEQSIDALEKSLAIAEQLQDLELQMRCLSLLTAKSLEFDFSYAEKYARHALELSQAPGKANTYFTIKALSSMAAICRENGKFRTGIGYLQDALKLAERIGDILLETAILNDLGFDYGRFISSQAEAQEMLRRSIALRVRSGLSKSAPLGNSGWLLMRQGKWKQAEECFQQALEISDKRSQAIYRGSIGRLYELQENYSQAELELLYRLEVLERGQELQNLFGYTGIMLNYALSGNTEQSKRYLEIARTLFEWETRPRRKWWCLYEIAEGYRILKDLDAAQNACQKSIEWFLNNTEHAEETIYLAEARLVMAKILIDKGKFDNALPYLNQANIAFKQCAHYARGETFFSLGKAHHGLGNTPQAQEYTTNALHEFQRLELHHKAQEAQKAQKILDKIT